MHSISKIESQKDVRGLLTTFSEVWGAETLSELISSLQDTECIIIRDVKGGIGTSNLEDISETVGYLFYDRDDRGFAEITDIGVMESCRGRGFGKHLVNYVLASNDIVRLSVKANNPARFVYEKLGFKTLYTVENYYGVGFDGIRMEWMNLQQ